MGIHALVRWAKGVMGRRPTGQVSGSSDLGRWIEHLSSLQSVTTIVEVGTWRGNGTTRRIAKGLGRRDGNAASAVCVEFNRGMANEAMARHRKNPAIRIVWGRLVEAESLDGSDLTDEEIGWFQQDLSNMDTAPNVFGEMPEAIDLLILDGGEFSTLAEFLVLKDRVTGWIALDDTRTRKCREIVRRIGAGEDPQFVVADESDERNGIMILRRAT